MNKDGLLFLISFIYSFQILYSDWMKNWAFQKILVFKDIKKKL